MECHTTGNSQVGGSRFNEAPNVLYFDKLTREDNGAMYECVATNEYGQSAPAPVRLDVLCMFLKTFCQLVTKEMTWIA